MATYTIGGHDYELPDDITPEQLQGVVASLSGGGSPSPQPAPTQPQSAGSGILPEDPNFNYGSVLPFRVEKGAIPPASSEGGVLPFLWNHLAVPGFARSAIRGADEWGKSLMGDGPQPGTPASETPTQDELSTLAATVGAKPFGFNSVARGTGRAIAGDAARSAAVAIDPAAADLARMIKAKADAQGLSLTDVRSNGDTQTLLKNVQNDLVTRINANAKTLADRLDPEQAADAADRAKRIAAQSGIRAARTLAKSMAAPEHTSAMDDLVGDTSEGQQLIDDVNKTNILTGLYNGGLKGGVSRITDQFSPFTGMSDGGFTGRLNRLSSRALLGLPIVDQAIGTVAAGAGRAIDAMTGARYPISKFVEDNIDGPTLAGGYAPSVVAQKAAAKASQTAQAEADAQSAARMRSKLRFANDPTGGGLDRIIYDQTGLLPQQVDQGMLTLLREGAIEPRDYQQFFSNPKSLMRGNRGNMIVRMLGIKAKTGQLARDPEWTPQVSPQAPGSGYSPAMAQAMGNQARVTAAQGRLPSYGLPPDVTGKISGAISLIGRTNNKADANGVLRSLLANLPDPVHRAIANQEASPLIDQIKHATRADAEATRASP